MNNDYKKIFLIFFAVFSLIILASFQIAFLNQFRWGFNIFLVLISLLILTKNIYGAIFLGWFGGFLIILQKKALLTLKSENILATGAFAVFFYHFLSWIMNNILTRGQEKFSFHFLDSGIIVEFLLT